MPTVVLLWVWFCAYLNCAGWALSAIHELNARGYAVALLIWFIALCVWRKRTSAQILPRVRWQKIRRRFRRPFPLAFLILAALAFLGGVIVCAEQLRRAGLSYSARVALAGGGSMALDSHRFSHASTRAACGIEWVSAPFIALLKTDRSLFLINVISLSAVARPGLQRVYAARCAAPGGVALDVDCADGLRPFAASRKHWQRSVRRNLCAGGGGICAARKPFPAAA